MQQPDRTPRVKKRILVTDGEQRAALAIVRSLGNAGHEVFVCSVRPRPLAAASRYAAAKAQVRDAMEDAAGFAADVQRLCRDWQIEVLIPVTEPALLALLSESGRPAGVLVPFVSLETFDAISDKPRVLARARELGIDVPEQRVIEAPGDAERIDAAAFTYPVVLKPGRSVNGAEGNRQKLSVLHAADAQQLIEQLRKLPAAAFPLLIQQRIVGPGTGVFLLLCNGEVRAHFAHRRLREKPPSGGVSVYSESIASDAALVDRAASLLNSFAWSGVAMVEFKTDERTGRNYLMEVNGRFWGSLQLAIDAGVDFPRLLVQCAVGEAGPSQIPYRIGVRSRWWWGDVDHLIARLRHSRERLHLPAHAGGRAHAVREFLRLRRADRSEVFRWRDPLPIVRETLDWLARR